MANTIRIKRSASTNVPAANLAQGELANSETGSPNGLNELYIGVTGPSNFKLIRNLNGAPAEPTAGLAAATPVTADYMVFEDVTDSQGKRVLFSATPLSIFNNDSGWNNYVHPNHTGQVDSVADGATSLNVTAITAQPAHGAIVGTDTILSNDGGVLSEATFTQMVTYFNGALSFGTVTSVAAGNGMDFTTITGAGSVVLGTPSSNLSGASTNAVAATSHTHAIDTSGTGDILAVSGGTLTGQLNCADQDLNRPVLEDYGVKHSAPTVSGNAVTLDCTVSNSFLVDMDPATAAVAVTLSNPPASGTYGEMTIAIVMGTPAYGITWPGSVTWQGGAAPNLTSTNNVVDLVHLFTVDGGTNWYGTFSLAAATAGGGTVTAVTGGVGIDSTGGTTPDISLNLSELTVATMTGADWIAFDDAGATRKALVSGISVGLFDNAVTEYVSENDTLVVADWNWVLDQDTMSSNSAVHVPTQQSVKAYVDTEVAAAVASEMTYKGGYNAATNTPALDTGSPVLAVGDMYHVTVAGTFFALAVVPGDVLIANTASVDAAAFADWDIVEGLQQVPDATETVKGILEIATTAEADGGSDDARAITSLKLHATTFDGGTF